MSANPKERKEGEKQFAFKHTVLAQNESRQMLKYADNLEFADVKVGDAVCTRVLMDTAVTRKHIAGQLDKFCIQIRTSLAKVCFENKDKLQKRIERRACWAVEKKAEKDRSSGLASSRYESGLSSPKISSKRN